MPLVASSRLVDRTSFKSPILLEKSLIKGNLIHKLLEFLPSSSSIDRTESMEKFLHKYAPDFSNIERQQIISSCLTILQDPNFSYIFSDGSRAEVPITGIIENKFIISGQIDRLIITDDKVIIIDYKTNLDPPSSEIEVPSSYLRQMAAYRLLLKQIYPSKVITCALIWTQGPLLMEISSNLLESQQLSDVII
jgi:ATP-dependent helicase/nuclease subunit A